MIQTALAGIGFSQCKFFESPDAASKGGTHCFAAVGTDPDSGKQIGVVVFRGTDADDPTDIGDDADLLLKPWDAGGSVHTGFANALAAIRPALDDSVKSSGGPILFTGHSLGAALATLGASLYKATAEVLALYTIGSPRVGNSAFVTTLDGMDIFRYRDCCDVVTRVPLTEMGYAHVGPARYIDRNGLVTLDPSETVIGADRVAAEADYLLKYAWKSGNVGVRDLADHAPINYVWAVTA
jgi:pimeloyl-ACP methyl ester carboxylesterase